MGLKQYNVTPGTASTDADLIPTIPANYALAVLTLQIVAPTAATVNIKFYNAAGTLAQTVSLLLDVGDTVIDDSKYVIPAGGKIAVNSTQTDTTFTAHGNLMAE